MYRVSYLENICKKCAVQQWLLQHPEHTQTEDELLSELLAAFQSAKSSYQIPVHQWITKNVCRRHGGQYIQ